MNKRLCLNRTKIEVILITSVAILIIVLITLTALLVQSKAENSAKEDQTCRTQICQKEALNILNRIDTKINPCDDFYAFACNNVKHLKKDDFYGPFKNSLEKFNQDIEAMYSSPVNESEHPVVVLEKTMYQMCLNETVVEKGSFEAIQDALIYAGGWPVLYSDKWNEADFDWVQTTYKLRSLGYLSSIFLELNVVVDPEDKEKYILMVSIPEVKDVYSKYFDSDETNGFMADVAVAFGAQIHRAFEEMTQTLDFLLDLQWIQNNNEESDEDTGYHRMTLAEVQRNHGAVNWLNFIKQITNVQLTYNDYVLFPPETSIDHWMSALVKAPKRLIANYMMWRVVEDNLEFITDKLRSKKIQPRLRLVNNPETRSDDCMELLRDNFAPSPVDITYLRKQLPQEKSQKLLSLLKDFQLQLKNTLAKLSWIDESTRTKLNDKIDQLKFVLGAPSDYFDENLFDNIYPNVSVTTFVNTLAKVKLHNLNQRYGLIRKSPEDTKLYWWRMSNELSVQYLTSNTIDYQINPRRRQPYLKLNLDYLELSPTIIYNEKRPNYLNYGVMGLELKNVFYKLVDVSYDWLNNSKCAFNTTGIPDYLLYQPLSHLLSTTVSYSAYKSLFENNREELLFPLDYSPEQLFWIASGEIYCYYTNPSLKLDPVTKNLYDTMIKSVINRNSDLMNDFKCVQRVEEKCSLY